MDVMIKVPRAGLDYGSGHAARVGKHSVIQQRRGIRWTKRASPPLSPVAMADNPFYVKWWRGMPRTRLARLARVATPCRKAEDVESRTTTRSCQSRLVSGWRLSEVEPPPVPTSRWASYQQIHDSPRKSLLIWSCPPPGLRPCSHHSPKETPGLSDSGRATRMVALRGRRSSRTGCSASSSTTTWARSISCRS
jgi:hypothetical protein